jgi:hypothetical protein
MDWQQAELLLKAKFATSVSFSFLRAGTRIIIDHLHDGKFSRDILKAPFLSNTKSYRDIILWVANRFLKVSGVLLIRSPNVAAICFP